MTRKKGLELTDAQQLLLCRYFDQECNCIGRFLAQRLVKTNAEAREYIETLRKTGMSCREAMKLAELSGNDLWERIEARIEAEERAALYLGARALESQESLRTKWQRVSTSQLFLGGLSGAAVTAMALLVLTSPTERPDYPKISTGAGQTGNSNFTQVGLSAAPHENTIKTRPMIIDELGGSSALEVDWMRANGPLRFIQNPGQRSAIIWVTKRRPSSSAARPNRAAADATPTVTASFVPGLDEATFDTSK